MSGAAIRIGLIHKQDLPLNRIVEFGMKESLQTINLDDGNLAGYTDQQVSRNASISS